MGPMSVNTRKQLGADANWSNISSLWRSHPWLRLGCVFAKFGEAIGKAVLP
jgi:hypothetical protein